MEALRILEKKEGSYPQKLWNEAELKG